MVDDKILCKNSKTLVNDQKLAKFVIKFRQLDKRINGFIDQIDYFDFLANNDFNDFDSFCNVVRGLLYEDFLIIIFLKFFYNYMEIA